MRTGGKRWGGETSISNKGLLKPLAREGKRRIGRRGVVRFAASLVSIFAGALVSRQGSRGFRAGALVAGAVAVIMGASTSDSLKLEAALNRPSGGSFALPFQGSFTSFDGAFFDGALADATASPTAPAPTAPVSPSSPSALTWDFDRDHPGRAPTGWSSVVGNWVVIPDPTAPTLPNTFGLSPGRFFSSLVRLSNYYPLAVAVNSPRYRNFVLEAWFKTVGGRLDCSGGLVFGYQNPRNYYVMEAGCPSDYFAVARAGKERYEVLGQTVVPIALERWYKLKLDAVNSHVTCYVDGRVVLRVNVDRLRPGDVGLWARADAQARFDDITLAPLR
jgi:hypothetical protein